MMVWVTRPAPANETTAAALRQGGHSVLVAPLLEIALCSPTPMPAGPSPDWLIFVSSNAVAGMRRLHETGRLLGASEGMQVAAVGAATAQAAAQAGWPALVVPDHERSEGLLAELKKHDLGDKRIWIPAGNRSGSARQEVAEQLRAAGAEVEIFQVYETRDRQLSSKEQRALRNLRPDAYVVHSPSAAEAVWSSDLAAVKRLRSEAVAVAIGPTTALRLRGLGAPNVHTCPSPSDAALLDTLASLDAVR